jgi:hypothetical protein
VNVGLLYYSNNDNDNDIAKNILLKFPPTKEPSKKLENSIK